MSIKRNDTDDFILQIALIRAKLDENPRFRYDKDWQHNNTLECLNNTVDAQGNTIWNYIINHEEIKVLKFLLRETILDPNQNNTSNNDGTFTTPLNAAARGGHYNIALVLSDYAKLNKKDSHGMTPLICAIQCEHNDLFARYLFNGGEVNVNKKDSRGMTPLHHAVKYSRIDIVNLLIQNRNIRVDEKNNRGDSPLHIAAQTKPSVSPQVVEMLLAAGAHIDQRGNCDKTPLHSAIIEGNAEIVKLLIANKANVNTKMDNTYTDEYTPLHSAVLSYHVETVNLLLRNFADPNAKSDIGGIDRTPLDALLHFHVNDMKFNDRLCIAKLLLHFNCDLRFLTVDRLMHMGPEFQKLFVNHYDQL
jgi:ankyrin repeat protein